MFSGLSNNKNWVKPFPSENTCISHLPNIPKSKSTPLQDLFSTSFNRAFLKYTLAKFFHRGNPHNNALKTPRCAKPDNLGEITQTIRY
ncbi:hypothetical protein Sjap_020091 [Stephania japonica]|uniref:Uncharacterized protein n=1 Tax=Stephania japonica TaxID=461633 RepID=A0AAP0HYQ3_9MAGN